MNRFMNSKKILMGAIFISLVGTVSLSFLNNEMASKSSNIKNVNSGLGICYQRISQTFTALMIGDFKSNFLSNEFKGTTGECFKEVKTTLSKLMSTDKTALMLSHNFASDLHWFNNKVSRVARLAKKDGVNLSQSNLNAKFESLDSLKSKIEERLNLSIQKTAKNQKLGLWAILGAQGIMLLSLVGLFIRSKKEKMELKKIERAIALGTSKPDTSVLLKKIGKITGLPQTSQFLLEDYNKLQSENHRLEAAILKVSEEGATRFKVDTSSEDGLSLRSSIDFQETLNTVLGSLKSKVFSSGVVIDTDLAEDFSIYSQAEELQQFLYYMLNYSIESALEGANKVIITSKTLGGVAYCKVKIMGHSFSESELKVINSSDIQTGVNMNLVLLKELLRDANVSIAVKNKLGAQETLDHSCEVEIIMERAEVKKTAAANVKILKGKKKDIQRILEQNM